MELSGEPPLLEREPRQLNTFSRKQQPQRHRVFCEDGLAVVQSGGFTVRPVRMPHDAQMDLCFASSLRLLLRTAVLTLN